MSNRTRATFTGVVAAAALGGSMFAAQVPGGGAGRSSFRADTLTVPVDVRVTDREGRPVTDLKQADFRVLENGVPQAVTQFWSGSLGGHSNQNEPQQVVEASTLTTRSNGVASQPPARVFLIVLGRGNLVGPSNGLEGIVHLVRDRLLPRDRVALMGWNRATPFTTDHEALARVIERLQRDQVGINARLARARGSLSWLYGDRGIPSDLQRDIDAVFAQSQLRTRSMQPDGVAAARLDAGFTDALSDVARTGNSGLPQVPTGAQVVGLKALDNSGMTFDSFVAQHAQTIDDTNALYMGIEYLRAVEGEKQLVWLCEYGIYYRAVEDDQRLARAAADARVALNIIRAGGVESVFGPNGGIMEAGSLLSSGASVTNTALRKSVTSRTFADVSGGRYDANRFPNASISADYIEQASRFEYLLGYSPANVRFDGKFRDIKVEVRRPNVTVSYRHGYFANLEPRAFDRQAELSFSRIGAAAGFEDPIHDVGVSATARGSSREVAVEVHLDPATLQFDAIDGRPTAMVHFGLFCLDSNKKAVGQLWSQAELTMTPERRAQVSAAGGSVVNLVVPVKYRAATVKVVVYDDHADMVGSVNVSVK